MKILFATSEAAPFIKSGGLGDVSQALPYELSKNDNVDIRVIIPYYKSIKENLAFNIEFIKSFAVTLSWRVLHVGIFKSEFKGVTYYFIDNEYYFLRDGLYGHYDDGERYSYFSKAVLESIAHIDFIPDIIHSNDWQTALIPVFLRAFYYYPNIKTVFTIHNIEYQGKVPNEFFRNVLGLPESWFDLLFYTDCLNFMKCAIDISDRVTTVSKTYSHEIRHAYFACGLEDILKRNEHKLYGIINGIDQEIYNPKTDSSIFKNYDAKCIENKVVNKKALQERLNLPINPDVPIVAMISRLVSHKGLELVEYVSNEMMNLDMQFVVIGMGDKRYQDLFGYLSYIHPDKMSANIVFDPTLANQIYAGADFLLMPSKSEPCGLSQMIAMRYGTIPIVNETGGLVDTVPPIDIQTNSGSGFTFKVFNAHDMLGAIKRGIDFYHNKDCLEIVIRNVMTNDYSWKNPSKEYLILYESI